MLDKSEHESVMYFTRETWWFTFNTHIILSLSPSHIYSDLFKIILPYLIGLNMNPSS